MRAEAVRERRVRKRRVRRLVRKVQRGEESAERVQVRCQERPREKCHGALGYTCCTGHPVLQQRRRSSSKMMGSKTVSGERRRVTKR